MSEDAHKFLILCHKILEVVVMVDARVVHFVALQVDLPKCAKGLSEVYTNLISLGGVGYILQYFPRLFHPLEHGRLARSKV